MPPAECFLCAHALSGLTMAVVGLFSEKVHQGGWPCSWLYYSFVVNKKFECWWFSCVSCNKYIIFKNIITYLSCLICILSMFDGKNPPKTWPICDIMTGTIKSALGHVLHAMLLNKTNLPENNICSALHTILKSYDNCHGFCKKEFETIAPQSLHSLPKSTKTFSVPGPCQRTAVHGLFATHV